MATRDDSSSKKGLPGRIRLLADLAGSTSALAAATGWTLRMVQRYASGAITPPRSKLIQLASITGCQLGWLERGTGPAPTDLSAVHAAIRRGESKDDWYPVSGLPGDESIRPLYQVSHRWIESICGPLKSPDPVGCLKVRDASMTPAYLPGETVLVAPIASGDEDDTTLWKDYAIQAYGEWYIRRRTPNGWEALTQGAVGFPFDGELVAIYGRVFAKVQVL